MEANDHTTIQDNTQINHLNLSDKSMLVCKLYQGYSTVLSKVQMMKQSNIDIQIPPTQLMSIKQGKTMTNENNSEGEVTKKKNIQIEIAS